MDAVTGPSSVSGWDDLARVDPLWAIVSQSDKRYGRWNLQDFLATGEAEVAQILDTGGRFGVPRDAVLALDFGCGVGRLTRALSSRFHACVGVDASSEMIAQARALHRSPLGLDFKVNDAGDLGSFDDDSFDLVLSLIVLQHLPSTASIETFIAEFCRVLRPGGLLAFQMTTYIPAYHLIQPRPRLYRLLRAWGVMPDRLHRLGLTPITMRALPDGRVRQLLQQGEIRVLDVQRSRSRTKVRSARYFGTK